MELGVTIFLENMPFSYPSDLLADEGLRGQNVLLIDF